MVLDMNQIDKNEIIYESMLQSIFPEYCDLVMTFLPESKVKQMQELGRAKAHAQKKRAKNGMQKLPKAKREQFVLGCYDELNIQLQKQLYRWLGDENDGKDFKKCVKFMDKIVNEEKEKVKIWIATQE